MVKRIPSFIATRQDDLEMLDRAALLLGDVLEGSGTVFPDAPWIAAYIANTVVLDGSPLTSGDVDAILAGRECPAERNRIEDVLAERDAWEMLEEWFEGGVPFDQALVLELHRIGARRTGDPISAGRYREAEVEIIGSDYEVDYPEFIAGDMADLVTRISESRAHPVVGAALFHAEFESIHPFLGANGRIGRILMNYLLMRGGFLPINISGLERGDYLDALKAYQIDENPLPIAELVIDHEILAMQGRLGALE
jgi:Fic family protein